MVQYNPQYGDLDAIFIARGPQIGRFHTLLNSWQSRPLQPLSPLDLVHIPGPVVLIHGESGFGKSTLLTKYHQIAQTTHPALQVSQIMDQKDAVDRSTGLLTLKIDPEIEAIHYFSDLQRQIAHALQQYESAFKHYHASLKEIQQARKELARVLDKETNIRTNRLVGLIKRHGRKKPEEPPTQLKLAQALGTDLQQLARQGPLLLFFDSYERIDEGDPLLRNVMYASGPHVGWIIAGQDDYWNLEQQTMRGLAEAASYQHHVLPQYSFAIELNAKSGGGFTEADILAYFVDVCKLQPKLPQLTVDDAQRIWQITRGIPLAVRICAEIFLRTTDIQAITTNVENERGIVESMIQRYFNQIPDISSIRARLYGLASLRRTSNAHAVQQTLEFSTGQEDDASSIQVQMQHQYGFILAENGQPTLHENVRHFLRRQIMVSDYDPEQKQVFTLLQQAQLEQLALLEQQRSYPDLFSRLADDTWIDTYLDLIEAQCWVDLYQAVCSGLALLLGTSLYRREVCPALITVIQPFEHKMSQPYLDWWQTAIQAISYPQQIQDIALIRDKLERIEQRIEQQRLIIPPPLAAYTPQLRAALVWQKGEIYCQYDEEKALHYFQTALAVFYHAKACDEHLAQLYWILAYNQSQKQAHQQSILYLTQALLLKPDFAAAHYNLGNAYYAAGLYNEALISYCYAIELEPTNLDAWVNLGNTRLRCKNYQQAIQEYTYVLQFEPHDAELYFNRGNAYKKDRSYLRALKDLSIALDIDPRYVEAYVNRGNTYAALKMPEQAFNDYQKACELDPDDMQASWMREWICFGKEFPGLAVIDRLKKLAGTNPTHYVATICYGIAHGLQSKDLKIVLDEMNQAVASAPDQWDPYFWRGMVQGFLGRSLSAQEDLQRALENGLPDLLLYPVYWLETRRPDFFTLHARSILQERHLYP